MRVSPKIADRTWTLYARFWFWFRMICLRKNKTSGIAIISNAKGQSLVVRMARVKKTSEPKRWKVNVVMSDVIHYIYIYTYYMINEHLKKPRLLIHLHVSCIQWKIKAKMRFFLQWVQFNSFNFRAWTEWELMILVFWLNKLSQTVQWTFICTFRERRSEHVIYTPFFCCEFGIPYAMWCYSIKRRQLIYMYIYSFLVCHTLDHFSNWSHDIINHK